MNQPTEPTTPTAEPPIIGLLRRLRAAGDADGCRVIVTRLGVAWRDAESVLSGSHVRLTDAKRVYAACERTADAAKAVHTLAFRLIATNDRAGAVEGG